MNQIEQIQIEQTSEELRNDFMREIRGGAMEYYVNDFPKDIQRFYSVKRITIINRTKDYKV